MRDAARAVASRVREASHVQVVSHIDADGITAGSIASAALDAVGIDSDVRFVKKLDEPLVDELKAANHELVWFTDLGSGYTSLLGGLDCVISDHHVPDSADKSGAENGGGGNGRSGRKSLFDFSEPVYAPNPDILQVNPHLFGKDGSTEISGAGCAYLVARELDGGLKHLAALAIVGAVGDLQDRENNGLVGLNIDILADGMEAGVLDKTLDIKYFGTETRPLYKFIQYANEPPIPGLSGEYHATMSFLMDLEMNLKEGERWRTWADLSRAEKRRLISGLSKYVDREDILGEVYILPEEEPGTPLHEAKEFATLMNSCGRYGKADLGLAVCKGDRASQYSQALGLQGGHRKNLVESMKIIHDIGVEEMDWLQFCHAGDRIMDTVIGIVAGMVLGSGEINGNIPFFAFAESDEGIKVSGRATKDMVAKGLDLSELMAEITAEIGGAGGGHNIAAGATIPPGTEPEFLKMANSIVKRQMGGGHKGHVR